MFEALNPHGQPLDHGSQVRHTHLFGCTPHVWLLPVEYPLHQQLVQNSIDVPHPCPLVPHPSSSLHLGKPDEVTEVEVISLVVVPVLPLLVDPLDQRVGSGIRTGIHGRTAGRMSICHTRHMGDGTLAIATGHIVAVEVVAWHDELVGWECW